MSKTVKREDRRGTCIAACGDMAIHITDDGYLLHYAGEHGVSGETYMQILATRSHAATLPQPAPLPDPPPASSDLLDDVDEALTDYVRLVKHASYRDGGDKYRRAHALVTRFQAWRNP